jgi:hypothetical protein
MRPLSSRQKLLLACALAVAVVAGVVVAVWPREPWYEGKPLSYWLDDLPITFAGSFPDGNQILRSWDAAKAENAVKELGPRSLPTVVKRLRLKQTSVAGLKYTLQYRAAGLHLCRYPDFTSEPRMRRGQAVTALVLLGDTAKPVLPQVLALAKTDPDPGVRASALEVVRRLSPGDYAQVTGQTNELSAATSTIRQ